MEFTLLFMAIVLVKGEPTTEQDAYVEKMSDLVVRVLGQHAYNCHLVFLTTPLHSTFVSAILR